MNRLLVSAFLLVSGFLAWGCPQARADVSSISDFKILATGDFTTPSLVNHSSSTATFSSMLGYGGGVIYEHQLRGGIYTRGLFIDVGAIYSRRTWEDSYNGQVTTGTIEAPLYLNLRLASLLSINLGGYYAFDNIGSQVHYITSRDYGLLGGAEIGIPLTNRAELVGGVNYLFGLANVSSVGGNLELEDMQVFIGMRFGRMGVDTFFPSW